MKYLEKFMSILVHCSAHSALGLHASSRPRVRGRAGRQRRPGVPVDRQDQDSEGVERGAPSALLQTFRRSTAEDRAQGVGDGRERYHRVRFYSVHIVCCENWFMSCDAEVFYGLRIFFYAVYYMSLLFAL